MDDFHNFDLNKYEICCLSVRTDANFVKTQTKNGILQNSWQIGFIYFVFHHLMLDYAPITLFGNLCYRSWIMPVMLFDAAGKNLCPWWETVWVMFTFHLNQMMREIKRQFVVWWICGNVRENALHKTIYPGYEINNPQANLKPYLAGFVLPMQLLQYSAK